MCAPITNGTSFVAEIPFSHLGVQYRSVLFGNVRESEEALGNPYFGLAIR
jgi:hypothetical protein